LYRKTLFSTKSATSIQNIMFLTVLVIVFLPHFQCRIYSALCMPNVSSAFTTVQNYYHWNTPQKTACNVRNRTHTHTNVSLSSRPSGHTGGCSGPGGTFGGAAV